MKTFIINANPKPKSGLAFADNEVHLPSPVRFLALLSSPSADSHIYIHLMPLSKTASASPLTTTGSDAWIPLQGGTRNFPAIRFDRPIDKFYISGDGGASASAPDFMLLCSDDLDLEIGFGTGASVANPLPISGTVSVSNFPATQPVSGTVAVSNFPATQETVEQGAANGAVGQITVAATTTVVVAARATRRAVIVTQMATGTDVFLAIGTAATTGGDLLPGVKGASITIPTNAAVNGIVATGTANVSFAEIYD